MTEKTLKTSTSVYEKQRKNKLKVSSSSAILSIIEERRADFENLVKYAVLRVRKFFCFSAYVAGVLTCLCLPSSENQP